MAIFTKTLEMERLQEVIRYLDNDQLSDSRRLELEKEKERLEESISNIRKSLVEKEEIKMEENKTQETPVVKEKTIRIRDIVESKIAQAEQALKDIADNNQAVLISLTHRLMNKFRHEKRAKKATEVGDSNDKN